jgi:catechol 2,3-dioxygenase-like lactoylglutathione lyase family enzyme
MIDHVILTVSDFERSVAFYNKALKPLGSRTSQITKVTRGTPI